MNGKSASEHNEKRFRVALSFPGERRSFVEKVARHLCDKLGKDKVFYDKNFESELARPNLDTYLQEIYHDKSELIAVFLCKEYEAKEWCGLEWRAIRDLIKKRQDSDIMPLRFDNTDIPGLFSTDGYIDIADRSAEDIAAQILKRIDEAPPDEPSDESAETEVREFFSEHWPETDRTLFGRDEELALLDSAWNDGTLNIAVLVAAGGVGKTALVNHWARERMEVDGWRGAKQVYAVSFYSQGTSEDSQASASMVIDEALRWFADGEPVDTSMDAYNKGYKLAELVRKKRTLLLLDGMEPLQELTGAASGHPGRVKDPGVRGLLRGLATKNPGLCVVTTRVPVADLKPFADAGRGVSARNLDNLTPETGADYLRSLGVEIGSDEEFQEASEAFGNHALALTLLGRYLVEHRGGDVRRRDEIPDLFHDEEQGGHAKRVMAWYAKVFAHTPEGELLHILGLFDRPAEMAAIQTIRTGDPIDGLTTRLNALAPEDWNTCLKTLRNLRLVAEKAPSSSGDGAGAAEETVLDCHPLVREYFGERLKTEQPEAWKAAHDRLYRYYCKVPEKDLPDTFEEMAPLYQAVVHGCHAGRHQEAFEEIYRRRIHRGQEAYSIRKLGAFGAELSAMASFFALPWSSPATELSEGPQTFVLHEAAMSLRALGRLAEAVAPMEAGLGAAATMENWWNAAAAATTLSELLLTLGRVEQARNYSEQAMGYADDSRDEFPRMAARTSLADALHQAARLEEAGDAFQEAEAIQAKHQPETPLLVSLWGFRYCDLILGQGDAAEAQRRARRTLEWAVTQTGLLDIALDHLTLGRAALALTDEALAGEGGDLADAAEHLDAAVDGLRQAGQQQFLPLGLLARAEYYRHVRDFRAGRQDLEEAWDIAVRCGMRLFECDVHLECARFLADMAGADTAMDVADLAPDSPFARFLDRDGGDWKERALAAARKHVGDAAKLIEDTGYHRRDPEIPELTGIIDALG